MIGTTVGHYKIEAKLGEGGMGVVYKATDTKLTRTVALKFLPDRVTQDEAAKARFLQEAQAAARLNHNNICTIHGVEEVDGALFMVMEYVDGGTLRTKLPFSNAGDAIAIASHIAEALQEAHANDIVHRDIKADNIMLTSKGQAKVMDFGLAKLKGSLKLTRTSSTVGTLGYMAPEQIQGGEVDHRSDIFSFGVLLFEMLTGKLPFRGEHEAAMVYSIVNEEPQDINALVPGLSPIVSALITKCLEKDPADRYQHMDEIVGELNRAQKKTSRVMRSSAYIPPAQPGDSAAPLSSASSAAVHAETTTGRSKMVYAVGGAALVVVAVVAWFLFRSPGLSVNPEMVTRVPEIPFTQFSYAGLSPDGKWMAFPAVDQTDTWDVYFMHVDGGEPRKITNDKSVFVQQSADISPNGSEVAYNRMSDDSRTVDVYVVSALGGASRKIAAGGSTPLWRPDGKRIGFVRLNSRRMRSESGFHEFWSANTDGSDIRREYVDSLFNNRGGDYRYNYCWSPDGKAIAWIRTISRDQQVIILRNLEEETEHQLTDRKENIDDLRWTKEDVIIFTSNRSGNSNLWAMSASGGEAVQITKGGGPDVALSMAASGNDLLYLQQQRISPLWTAGIDGSNQKQLTFDDRQIDAGRISPDGKRIAFVMRDVEELSANRDLYVMDRDGGNRRRLTNGMKLVVNPVWSPDSRKVSFSQFPSGEGADTGLVRLFLIDADNSGAPQRIGVGFSGFWLDDDHIKVNNFQQGEQQILTISTGKKRLLRDSVGLLLVMPDGWSLLAGPIERGRTGIFSQRINPETLVELTKDSEEPILVRYSSDRKLLLSVEGRVNWGRYFAFSDKTGDAVLVQSDGIHVFSTQKRTHRVIQKVLNPVGGSTSLSPDGKEILYAVNKVNAKIVLLEHIFEGHE